MTAERPLAERLVEVFLRLAQGDLTARLPRNFRQDDEDALAFLIDALASQIGERQRIQRHYEESVLALIEKFILLSGGDVTVRAERSGSGDAMDTMAYLLNNVAGEVGDLVSEQERQRVLLETLLESMLDGVLLLDPSGTILRANAAMGALLGTTANELAGKPIVDILAPSERALAAMLESGPALFHNRETQFRDGAGGTLAITVNGSPHRDMNGAAVGFVLVARDDRELRKLNAQLHLSERLATMGTLAAGVAHEINNPLAFLSANVDFAIEELQDGRPLAEGRLAEIIRALRSSREGARRVKNIVRDLHHFARGGDELTTAADLNHLFDAAAALVAHETRHHARVVKAYGAPPLVRVNEGRLVQVLLNLILNAAQAIPVGQAATNEIVLATGGDERESFAEVRDTGAGISDADLKRVFDLFYTTKPPGEGMGMGLAIARRLVEHAGGRIEVKSAPGKGSAFRVILPRAAPGAASAHASRAPAAATADRRLRVLAIDDEADVGESIRRLLGSDHEVTAVTTVADALRLVETERFDAILCDVLMPETTGIELFEQLARDRPDIATRFVFMTGGAFQPSIQQFLARVENARLEKPFEPEALRLAVERAAS